MSDFVYIDRFHQGHRAKIFGDRLPVEQFFATKRWERQRFIVQDEQILPEIMAYANQRVAQIALGLHVLSLKYVNPYLTTVIGSIDIQSLTGIVQHSRGHIANARQNPAKHVECIEKVQYASDRFPAGAQIKSYTQTALGLLAKDELTETMMFNRASEMAAYIFALRCMDLDFFNRQQTTPAKCFEYTQFHRTYETLPEGVNVYVQDQSKRPLKDGSRPIHQPRFVRGGKSYPGPARGNGRMRPGRFINIDQLLEASRGTISRAQSVAFDKKHGVKINKHPHREIAMPFDILGAN